MLPEALVCVGTVNLSPREPWRSARDLRARGSPPGNIRGTTAQLNRAKKADAARKKRAAVKATINRRERALAARGPPPACPTYRERQAAVQEQRTPVLPVARPPYPGVRAAPPPPSPGDPASPSDRGGNLGGNGVGGAARSPVQGGARQGTGGALFSYCHLALPVGGAGGGRTAGRQGNFPAVNGSFDRGFLFACGVGFLCPVKLGRGAADVSRG